MHTKRMFVILILLFAIPAVSTLSAGTVTVGGLEWYDNLAEAREAAAGSGKHIYIYFTGGSGCSWCVKMKGETFSNAGVKERVLTNVERVMLNVWKSEDQEAFARDKKLFKEYGGRGVPYNVLLDSEGKKIAAFSGFLPPEAFIEKMQTLEEGYKDYKETKKASEDSDDYGKLKKLFDAVKKLERFEEAAEVAEELRKLDPENQKGDATELLLVQATAAQQSGKMEEAKKLYEKVIEMDVDNSRKMASKASAALVGLHLKSKKNKEAVAISKKALAYSNLETKMESWFQLVTGYAYMMDGEKDRAKEYFELSIKTMPDSQMAERARQMLNRL